MIKYQLFDESTYGKNGIINKDNNSFIPIDSTNRDYIEYLAWAAAGNTPDPSPDIPALENDIVCKTKLDKSDYKVIKYRDQVANSHATDLTPGEYQTLLTDRQAWRDAIA